MKKLLRSAVLVSAALVIAASARAEEKKVTFDNKDAIAGWTVSGDVAVDAGEDAPGRRGRVAQDRPGRQGRLEARRRRPLRQSGVLGLRGRQGAGGPKGARLRVALGRDDGGRPRPGQRLDLCSVPGRRHDLRRGRVQSGQDGRLALLQVPVPRAWPARSAGTSGRSTWTPRRA